MTRNHRSAKKAGTSFERLVADHLALHVDGRIDRRVKTGAKDKGDIAGLGVGGNPLSAYRRVVVECKNTAKVQLAGWAAEAEAERLNDGAVAGVVVHKRVGVTAPGRQWVTMTLDDFIAIIKGVRPTSAQGSNTPAPQPIVGDGNARAATSAEELNRDSLAASQGDPVP